MCFRPHPPVGWWFRGQADANWPLVPKAGRKEYFLPNDRDIGRFNHWRSDAIAYFNSLPENDWECLALAQHHGLATRLLDWSFNPLVATYFASCEFFQADGAVYMFDPKAFANEGITKIESALTGTAYIPRAISQRILLQKSAFTIHNPPSETIRLEPHACLKDQENQVRVIIPKELKTDMLKMLDDYGINKVVLFPDLDGWSSHVNWETKMMSERKKGK